MNIDCSNVINSTTQYCQNQQAGNSLGSLGNSTSNVYQSYGNIFAICWLGLYMLITICAAYYYFTSIFDSSTEFNDDDMYAVGLFISGVFSIICGIVGVIKSYSGSTDSDKQTNREIGAWIATIPIIIIVLIILIICMVQMRRH